MTSSEKVNKLLEIYSFSNELGEKITFTESQRKIIGCILDLGIDNKKLVQIETPTRFGKSAAVAAAILMRCSKKEQWAIVAGTGEKAQIIMDYLIDFALQNVIPRELLKTQTSLDKLKQERSRTTLTFSSGFEVRVFTTDSRNKQGAGNAIMGFGAPFVVLDEAALVDDVTEAKIFRMIAGFSTTKHLYIKIGNPFYRNHFFKSHKDPDYALIHFDYKKGIEEGRYTQEMIEKARSKPGFDVLYDVKFPDADAIDDKGWSSLLTEEDIERAFVKDGTGFGFLKIGCDPSGEGNNFNTVVKRYRNYAAILFKEKILNQWEFSEKIINFKNKLKDTEGMMPLGYWIDKVGIGEGYYQTMRVDLENVYGINVGQKANNSEEYMNLRAEAYWRLRQDIKSGKIQLEKNDDWFQLAQIKYRTRLEGRRGKIEIMSKEEMRANGIESPDVADALMLTYTFTDPSGTIHIEEERSQPLTKFERYSPFNEI